MKKWLGIFAFALIIIVIALTIFQLLPSLAPEFSQKTKETMKIITRQKSRSYLDGTLKNADETNGVIFAVMIDNHSFGRIHHRGPKLASVFYETLAEGGITRILALFDGPISSEIGPVRSIRDYFIDFASEFLPVLVHIGGSSDALNRLFTESSVLDIDGMAYEGTMDYFKRDKKIEKPHNAFANLKSIAILAKEKKWDKIPAEPFFEFDADGIGEGEEAKTISLDFSFPEYKVLFEYDSALGFYKRFIGGEPHKDTSSNSQLIAHNILVQFTSYYPIDAEGRLKMKTEGQGKALLFRDEKVFKGAWKKEKENTRTEFLDENGKSFKLRPGITWIEIIDAEWRVKY